jgi:hypothetical protein
MSLELLAIDAKLVCMEVFVSGQIDDIDNVRIVQDAFTEAGHHITHDWTRNETGDQMLAGKEAKLANPEETARRATNDLQGVVDSDVYIICTDNERAGKGMYVELGAALALNAVNGSPKIYLLGSMNNASIFYFHPSIILGRSIQEVIEEIK